MKKELDPKYVHILQDEGWSITGYTNDGCVEIESYTPDGECFNTCVDVENFPEAMVECYNQFNPDEYVDMWVQARYSYCVPGVPAIIFLVRDAESIKWMLWNLAASLVCHDVKPPVKLSIFEEAAKELDYMEMASNLIHDFIDRCHQELDKSVEGAFRRVKNAVA